MTLLQQDADEMQFPMYIGQEAVIFFQIPKKKKCIEKHKRLRELLIQEQLRILYIWLHVCMRVCKIY